MRSRWLLILGVAALIEAGAIAGVSLYAWRWRGSDNERARAFADASVVSYDHGWTLEDASRVASGLWLARYQRSNGSATCVLVDVRRFERAGFPSAPLGFVGAEPTRC